MKLNKSLFGLAFFLTIGVINGCKENTENKTVSTKEPNLIGIYNFDNKQELADYNELNLDENHPNLLNPQISKSDYNSVIKSWTDLHQKIGIYLSKNNFTWDVNDNTISIFQKIYFEPNGQIKHYFFNVLNQNITNEKKEQFASLISEFAKTHKIDFQLDNNFAQCGKTKYLNE